MRLVLISLMAIGVSIGSAAAESMTTCSIRAGKVDRDLAFSLSSGNCSSDQHCDENNLNMTWSKWTGIVPADLTHEGATIDAHMRADSGEMRCSGSVHGAAMRGTFSFTPNPEFATRMVAMGFDGQTPKRLRDYALLDVTTAWVQDLKSAGVEGLTAENLMGLRALGVDKDYVKGMAAAGYPELRPDKLTGMKAVGVSPEKVQAIRAMGFSPTQDELIEMSVFKIDAPFVEKMKARGLKNLTIAQLVQIKVFKLDE
jgi:hypothetical protein